MSARASVGAVLGALAALAALACATPGTGPASGAASGAASATAAPAPPAPPKDVIDPPLPGEELLAEQPRLAPLADFAAPVPKLVELPSGLKLLLVERAGAPLQTLAFVVRRGATSDPAGRAGLASLAAAMLEAGSAGRSQAQIAAQADAIGATLRSSATVDASAVSLSALPTKLGEMVSLLADVALRPNLDEAEWKKLQGKRVAELQAQLAEPRFGAGLAFAAALYGDGPLGRPALGTPESVQAATLAEVKSFLGGFDPHEAAVIAVGAAPQAEVISQLTKAFGKWGAVAKGKAAAKKSKPSAEPAAPLAASPQSPGAEAARAPAAGPGPRLVLVDFDGRPQTVLRVGQQGVPRRSPDELALKLLNSVLGGSFTSRLNQTLREKNGYSYGAGSNFAFGRLPGPFAAVSSVKTQVTGLALAEVLKELGRVVAEPLSAEELQKGKALLAYGLVEALQHADATAAAVAELFVDELPLDELQTTVGRLRALTAEDVQAAAKRALQPGSMTIVLAGDWKAVGPQLKAAGLDLPEPQRRSPLGELVK